MIELKVVNTGILQYGIPSRETAGAAGYDLRACIEVPVMVLPETMVKIPTGIAIHIRNRSLAGFVMPRSGLAAKFHITLQNAVGLIDPDYQGEIQVLLRNEGNSSYKINPGDRIAQLVFVPIAHPILSVVNHFNELSDRGVEGFGSTGVGSRPLSEGPEVLSDTGYAFPSQSIGNEGPSESGLIQSVAATYEPTGQELFEIEHGAV